MIWFESPAGGIRWKGLKSYVMEFPPEQRQHIYDRLCQKYPVFFLEALTELEGSPTRLEPYQIKYLVDDSRFRIKLKTRQAGGSQALSFDKFYKAYTREGYRCDIASVNLKEARDKVKKIRALWETLPARYQQPLSIDNDLSIGFHQGGKQSVINSLAASSGLRGGKKDVAFDEAPYIKNVNEHFAAALPATSRGMGFDMLGTPMGQNNIFYDIYANKDGKYSQWSRHNFLWMDVSFFCKDTVAARKRWEEDYGENMLFMEQLFDEFASETLIQNANSISWDEFKQEYCGDFLTNQGAFYPIELVQKRRKHSEKQPNEEDYLELWTLEEGRPKSSTMNDVYIGIDFAEGKKGGDSTSIQVIERLNSNKRLMHRFWADLDHRNGYDDFDKQLAYINDVIGQFQPKKVCCDETGLGRKLAYDLKKVHGGLIEPVSFTNKLKEKMALNLKALLEKDKLWISYDNKGLSSQICNIERKITAAGNIQYFGEPHDDMFWALCLACKSVGSTGLRIITLAR